MAIREYSCTECGSIKEINKSVTEAVVPVSIEFCSICDREGAKFELMFSKAPYGAMGANFNNANGTGMAAVRGWGSYDTDYGKAGSDLIKGRAIEATQRFNGREISGPNR